MPWMAAIHQPFDWTGAVPPLHSHRAQKAGLAKKGSNMKMFGYFRGSMLICKAVLLGITQTEKTLLIAQVAQV